MSRPRYKWYPIVRQIIEYSLDERNVPISPLELCVYNAVNAALERTYKMEDGRDRIALISMVYHKRTHTVAGAGMKLHVSERTAQRWSNAFVYAVAEEMQLLPQNGVNAPLNRVS